jgi:hypothetical protein
VFHFALACILFGAATRYGLLRSRAGILFLGWYVFNLAGAGLMVAGRMDPNDNHFGNARAERYLTMALLTWAVLILVMCWVLAQRRTGGALMVACAATALLLGIGFTKLRWWFERSQTPYREALSAQAELLRGSTDSRVLKRIFPEPAFVLHFLPMLKKERLSIYSHGDLARPALGHSDQPAKR